MAGPCSLLFTACVVVCDYSCVLIPGTSIVADYCFWLFPRSEGSYASEANLLTVLRAGIKAYQQQAQASVFTIVHQNYPGVFKRGDSLVITDAEVEMQKEIRELILRHRMRESHYPRSSLSQTMSHYSSCSKADSCSDDVTFPLRAGLLQIAGDIYIPRLPESQMLSSRYRGQMAPS